MNVEIVATTVPTYGSVPEMDRDQGASHMEHLVEAAGRQCYESFHKPNSKTRANKDYIANILAQQHESVLEHASVTFRVTGVSRNLLLELERHRHLSFSVISQRYVDSSTAEFVYPPVLGGPAVRERVERVLFEARESYEFLVNLLISAGSTRKQAREAARSVLPGGIETKFLVTGNLRAWRDVLKKRYSTHADAEICALATEILAKLRTVAPNVFQDFPEVPFS